MDDSDSQTVAPPELRARRASRPGHMRPLEPPALPPADPARGLDAPAGPPAAAPATPVCCGQVVRDYRRYVLGLVRRLGVAEADAEDVAQRVCMAIHSQLPSYEGHAPLKAWICGICRNKVKDYHRQRSRVGRLLESLRVSPRETELALGPQDELLSRESWASLERALCKLPPKQHEVLVLHFVKDMPMKEVAELLACPLDTAYSRLRTGLQRLKASARRLGGQR